MKVSTIPGACYALTCSRACSVQAILHDSSSLVILEVADAGQYIFVAPSDSVEVSDEESIVTRSFKGAALGSSAQDGGIKNGQDAALNELTATTIGNTSGTYVTPMGTSVKIGAYVDNPTVADNDKRWLYISNHKGGCYLQTYGVVNGRVTPNFLNLTNTYFIDGFTSNKGATISGALNANGGINLPLATGASTDTSAVNRMYAAGLAVVADTYNIQVYLDKTASTVTNSGFLTELVPGQLIKMTTPAESATSAMIAINRDMIGSFNYGKFRGITIPIRIGVYGRMKVSMSMGDGSFVERRDRDIDAFTLVPSTSALIFGEMVDITVESARDADAGGWWIRTREIYWSRSQEKLLMRTTRALLPLDNNTAIPSCISGLVCQQCREAGTDTEAGGSLWLMVNGFDSRTCFRIADVRGMEAFGFYGSGGIYVDADQKTDDYHSPFTAHVGAPRFMQGVFSGNNPAYYGFKAIEADAIREVTTGDWIDPEA